MYVRQDDSGVEVWAPAKVNLFLEVLGKRPDGYHELETLICPIRWFDTLQLRNDASGVVRLECQLLPGAASIADAAGPSVTERGEIIHPERQQLPEGPLPEDNQNLVVRAVRLLRERSGISSGMTIRLVKRIPIAAGLAGGSSNAAAALVGACRLWGLRPSAEELSAWGAELGSDVPFFFSGSWAVCRGRGERVEAFPRCGPLHLVVVTPSQRLLTADVFRALRAGPMAGPIAGPLVKSAVGGERRVSVRPLCESLLQGRWDRVGRELHNRLQAAAEPLAPEIARLNDWFRGHDVLGYCMSGSGTSCFALCRNAQHARRLAAMLRARGVGTVRHVATYP